MSTTDQAQQLREAREAANLTQRELADRLGVSRRSVQGWENGLTPLPAHRRAIRDFLDGAREDVA